MRAMVVERYGAPLRMADLPVPTPGLRQVLVRVIGCGICRSDLKVVAGAMSFSPTLPLPHVPGHEISGEIVALGHDARGRVGDRVVVYHYWPCRACAHCRAGEETLCTNLAGWVGFATPGGFQEYLAVPDDCVLPLPQNIPPEHGGPLTCALGTAYQAVVSRGGVRAGEAMVVLGAGGVGLQAVQIGRAAGAHVLAIDLQAHRLEAARHAGAHEAFPAGEGVGERVRAATAGRGADLVIDTVGHHDSLATSTGLARTGGRIVVVGYSTDPDEYPVLPTDRLVLGQLSVLGTRYTTRLELRRALTLVARGLVQPVISGMFPLEQANEALAMVREDRATGRVVVRLSGDA
jgi:D-arabinose 1-dehydrogenase-like Zn-dependent alcohol dehydrogenase